MVIHAPQTTPVKLRFPTLGFGRSRHLDILANGHLIGSLFIPSDRPNQNYEVGPFTLQPGDTTIIFHSQEPPLSPAQMGPSEDARPITFAFLNLQVLPVEQKVRPEMQKPASFETGFGIFPHFGAISWAGRESNPESLRRQILSLLRMPVSPPAPKTFF